jgi:nucleotide-binding universal stress UspA family protein
LKKSISRILVAVDGSDDSFRAADYAMNLAAAYGADLFLVTVVNIPEKHDVPKLEATESKEQQKEMNGAKNWFETYTHKAKEKRLIIRPELVNSSRPVDYVLLEYAEENDIDLVVVGARGQHTFGRIVLGSVSPRLLTYSHCPVLLVR